MNKEQKQTAVKEIGEQLEASSAVFAVDYRGISVPQAAELRSKLREADASFTVVKNRLAKRVTADAGAESLDEYLVGPTALTYVRGDAVIAAKAIADFIKENETISYKGGIMDGDPLEPDQFDAIAKLPGLDVLHGRLVGLAASPLTGLVTSLNGLIQGLATQLGQISEQGLVGGDAPAEPEAAEDDAKAEAAEEAPAEEDAPAEPEAAADEPAADAGGDDEPDAPDAGEPGGSEEPAADAEPQVEGEDGADEAAEKTSESTDDGDAEKTDESDTESKED